MACECRIILWKREEAKAMREYSKMKIGKNKTERKRGHFEMEAGDGSKTVITHQFFNKFC